MSRDDIIRMAREAGLPAFLYPELIAETDWKLIERFAALVAAAEREWVGLTDGERNTISRHHAYVDNIIKATEAKLKEKNT